MTKLKKTDFFFIISLATILLMHIFLVFIVPYLDDESFYSLVPFRLMSGDSLVQNEWHLSQFSSLFSFIPVCIWTLFKGSAEGIILFMRIIYLLIHTTLAVIIYMFFRKHGTWAVMASVIFYIQTAYGIIAISYHSMFVAFLVLLTLCLLSIYQKPSLRLYIFAGICFGFCCVNNPLFCFAFAIYLLVCLLWAQREKLITFVMKLKGSEPEKKEKKPTKNKKKKSKQQASVVIPGMEKYSCFFGKEAFIRFACGILIAVAVALVFFFITGGTLDSITSNIENLLSSSEYGVTSAGLFTKFKETFEFFKVANFNCPWILLVLFIVLLIDKKRRYNTHRFVYLLGSVLWSIMFIAGVTIASDIGYRAISLPFCVISTICYLLTENKNKTLFYCMYIPCLIATIFQYFAADTHLAVIGIVLATNNIAGVLFAMDLYKEMHTASKESDEKASKKIFSGLCRSLIIIGFCLQLVFYGVIFRYWGDLPGKEAVKATTGPYSGLYMTEQELNAYNRGIADMDFIKEISRENDPVLLASYRNWMYMYLERPSAIYTAWYQGELKKDLLIRYYDENPDRIPEYVYIESLDLNSTRYQVAEELFEFSSKEILSNGVLYTVDYYKF